MKRFYNEKIVSIKDFPLSFAFVKSDLNGLEFLKKSHIKTNKRVFWTNFQTL